MRVLDLDLLLVPRPLVPAVQSLIRSQKAPESEEKPLYAVDEDQYESANEGSRQNDHEQERLNAESRPGCF